MRLTVRRRIGGKLVRKLMLNAGAGKVRVVKRTARAFVVRLDLRGVEDKRPVTLRIRAKLAGGKTVRQSRTFRTCTPKPR